METNLNFIVNHIFSCTKIRGLHGIVVACSTLELGVVGSNPIADIFFSSQIAVFMQNLGVILFKNHKLCNLAHFGTVRLYMGKIYRLVRPIYTK